ncbi:pantoate--beta-alanine ligase [Blastopirellula marina]|uniref:Pantothenate synthetase n=1 Tax=Blastopirellula marina TaxID=124 RepID=A0A2S8FSP4_9BACT|nr:pantoate--beta-alanine ligase [Blastopirellula marina]PQO35202.1 pantoate--beta-alanine ligase [Blastopirellula marina]PQO47993.1 pantoate--beta-alanine ligase [Blastopirellula marina]PTL43951.1 pantoate--beta-alanine ligase [Blastopirellula marina]
MSNSPLTTPELIHSPKEMRAKVLAAQKSGLTVGFVPTMGALHEGHLSLVGRAAAECDVAVVSIFVNPTQFGPSEDFAKYPRTLPDDMKLLSRYNPVWVFAPEAADMYPPGMSTVVQPPSVALPLEGASRPTHFAGVATVVLKLLNLVPADIAYFGQKDYQQACVIRQMVIDLDVATRIIVCPIVRDEDGLAMSSRNRYLSPEERTAALSISRALRVATERLEAGDRDAASIAAGMRAEMNAAGIREIDYAILADPQTLETLQTATDTVVILIAARVGQTRLIDNCVVSLTPTL